MNTCHSEVRAAKRGSARGKLFVPGEVGARTLGRTSAMGKGHEGERSKVIDWGSDFIPYN